MKLKLFTFVLTMLISIGSFAQITFQPGYYIDNNGEKIEGLIRFRNAHNSPTLFRYKEEKKSEEKSVSIHKAQEYGMLDGGLKFVGYNGELDYSKQNIQDLSDDRKPEMKYSTVFVKELVGGKASLYKFKNAEITLYLFSYNEEEISQLIYKRFDSKEGPVGENNTYKFQLLKAFEGINVAFETIQDLPYQEKELIRLFEKINTEIDPNYSKKEKNIERNKLDLFVLAGTQLGAFKSIHDGIDDGTEIYSENSLGFNAGIALDYYLPNLKNKWALTTAYTIWKDEIGYTFKNTAYNDNIPNGENPIEYLIEGVNFKYGVKYFFYLPKRSKLWCSVFRSISASYIESNILYSDKSTGETYEVIEYNKSFNCSIGYTYNERFMIELSHNKARYMDKLFFDNAKYSYTQLQLGYRIF